MFAILAWMIIAISLLLIGYNNGWLKVLNLGKEGVKKIRLRGILISAIFVIILGLFWIYRGTNFLGKPNDEALPYFMQPRFTGMGTIYRGIMLIAAGILTLKLNRWGRYLMFLVCSLGITKSLSWYLTVKYLARKQHSLMVNKEPLLSPQLRYLSLLNFAFILVNIAIIVYFVRRKVKEQFK